MLGLKNLTAKARHAQTNGQGEGFNKTLVGRFRHYLAEHQTEGTNTCNH